jgi:hypothetical protein
MRWVGKDGQIGQYQWVYSELHKKSNHTTDYFCEVGMETQLKQRVDKGGYGTSFGEDNQQAEYQ